MIICPERQLVLEDEPVHLINVAAFFGLDKRCSENLSRALPVAHCSSNAIGQPKGRHELTTIEGLPVCLDLLAPLVSDTSGCADINCFGGVGNIDELSPCGVR